MFHAGLRSVEVLLYNLRCACHFPPGRILLPAVQLLRPVRVVPRQGWHPLDLIMLSAWDSIFRLCVCMRVWVVGSRKQADLEEVDISEQVRPAMSEPATSNIVRRSLLVLR